MPSGRNEYHMSILAISIIVIIGICIGIVIIGIGQWMAQIRFEALVAKRNKAEAEEAEEAEEARAAAEEARAKEAEAAAEEARAAAEEARGGVWGAMEKVREAKEEAWAKRNELKAKAKLVAEEKLNVAACRAEEAAMAGCFDKAWKETGRTEWNAKAFDLGFELLVSREKEEYREYIGTCSVLFARLVRYGSSVGLTVSEKYMGNVNAGEFDLDRLYAKLMEIEAATLANKTNKIEFENISRLVVWVIMAMGSQVRLKDATNRRAESENLSLVG